MTVGPPSSLDEVHLLFVVGNLMGAIVAFWATKRFFPAEVDA